MHFKSIEKMQSSLSFLEPGPIHYIDHELIRLAWFSGKPSDNLHIFEDGIVIGKLSFSETRSVDPIYHETLLPDAIHSLLNTVILRKQADRGWMVIPNESTSVYFCNTLVSDMQLLIAFEYQLMPSKINLAILGLMGYFPGNLTLFKEIQMIRYLYGLSLETMACQKVKDYKFNKHDDEAMVNRLAEIIPKNVKTYLGLSGGMDSRFVLGILLKSNVKPELITQENAESSIANEIADVLSLSHKITITDNLDAYSYTMMTDGLIYFKGGAYSRLRNELEKNSLFHLGLNAGAIIENNLQTAWKRLSKSENIYEDLIWHGLLNFIPKTFYGYKHLSEKEVIFNYLKRELKFGKEYYQFHTKKQWSSWFFHLHGLRWISAHTADLSFYSYPINILLDREAVSYGLSSSAYSNFYKDRLRKLNQDLLPQVQIDYSEGRPYKMKPIIVRDIYKIYHEFLKRFVVHVKNKKKKNNGFIASRIKKESLKVDQNLDHLFKDYFIEGYDATLQNNQITNGNKRAAITLYNTLKFLKAG